MESTKVETTENPALNKGAVMPRLSIPEWEGLTEYRPPIFEQYEFQLEGENPKTDKGIFCAGGSFSVFSKII